MKKLSRNAMIGYPAGIITGITYGLTPLFGMPLMLAQLAGIGIGDDLGQDLDGAHDLGGG